MRVLDRKIPSAKDSREFSRIVRLRELILTVVRMRASRKIHCTPCMVPYRCKFVPNVRRNYLKARGFPRDSGLVRNGSNPPSHESRSLLFGRISPREGQPLAPWHIVWCGSVSGGRNSKWTTAEALGRARTGHGTVIIMETLASQALQPTAVIQVTEPRDRHHRSPSGVLRTYPYMARGDVWHKMNTKCWSSSSSS